MNNCHASLVLYAVDDENSFGKTIDSIIEKLNKEGNMPKMLKVLIGNKSDLPKERRKISL